MHFSVLKSHMTVYIPVLVASTKESTRHSFAKDLLLQKVASNTLQRRTNKQRWPPNSVQVVNKLSSNSNKRLCVVQRDEVEGRLTKRKIERHSRRERERETDRQAGRQTDRQADRRTNRTAI